MIYCPECPRPHSMSDIEIEYHRGYFRFVGGTRDERDAIAKDLASVKGQKKVPDSILDILWKRASDTNDAKSRRVIVEDVWLYRMINEIRDYRKAMIVREDADNMASEFTTGPIKYTYTGTIHFETESPLEPVK